MVLEKFYEIYKDHRYYYIVKDDIDGGLLFDRFHANPSFTESNAAYII